MWYFSWILGVGVALAAGVIGALWFEAREERQTTHRQTRPREVLGPGAQGTA
jgi:cytochrome bd-I ubiquinol oxidase subunit X